MRIDEPKRPGEDAGKNAEQVYKWMYRVTEQLNMMMEQLERNNVLDLMATGIGTTAQNGLIGGNVEDNSEDLALIKAEQENIKNRLGELNTAVDDVADNVEVLEGQLGGYTILIGTSTLEFGTTATNLTVKFGKTFASKPVVVTNQVFDDANVTVSLKNVTTTQFLATTPGGAFTSTGTRDFNWVAIGKQIQRL